MERRLLRLALCALGSLLLTGCAESLYLTTSQPLIDNDNYVFMGPYFAEVKTDIVVSIIQGQMIKVGNDTVPGPPTLTLSVMPRPLSRAYLYLSKNALFNDSANVNVGSDGMLSSSDTSSTQQVTAILTELAQTAGAIHTFAAPFALPGGAPPVDIRKSCSDAVNNYIKDGPRYNVFRVEDTTATYQVYPRGTTTGAKINLQINIPLANLGQENVGTEHNGLLAYYPVPGLAVLTCRVGTNEILLMPPAVVNLYLDSHFVDPKRDLLTNPQDTWTFNAGIITGHKYAAQSPVKTIVDIGTAPVRALMPSVTVTTNTAVQTGGGKPDQTTTTTNTQVAPPK